MNSISTTPIIIQPDISTPLSQCGLFIRIYGGRIERVRGIGGLTQAEDSADIPLQDDTSFRWRDFLWMHYSALVVDVSGPPSAVIGIQGQDNGHRFRLDELTNQAMRIALAAEEAVYVAVHAPEESGAFRISPDVVEAGAYNSYTIEYIAGEKGVHTGGGIRIRTPFSAWTRPILSDDSVELIKSSGATVKTTLDHCSFGILGSTYTVTVESGEMVKGDILRVRMNANGGNIKAQTYAKEAVVFPVFADILGYGIFQPVALSDTPSVRVKSGPARKLRLVVPMVVSAGEYVTSRVIALDQHHNPIEDDNVREVELRAVAGEETVVRTSIRLKGGKNGQCQIKLDEPGWYVLSADSQGLEQANLVVKCVSGPEPTRLYWGAIHGHTEMSDGEFPPDDYFSYGRDTGLVDFCAVADHDWELVEHERNRRRRGLQHIEELVSKYHEPGTYVTITGYEWMSPEGHINIYYDNDCTGNPAYIGNVSIMDRVEAPTVARLIELYKGRDDVLLIPHSSHGQAWESFDEDLMPVVEMYSCWGSSEHRLGPIGSGMQEGLRRGYKFGFIGGADSHHGSPGHTGRPSKYHKLACREGFAAVYASELTREAIFEALRRRSCYATTAERILLEFRVNGAEMGTELSTSPGDILEFKGIAGGTSAIETIQLIRDGEVIESVCGSSLIEHFQCESNAIKGQHYYYLRVTESDGEMAWSSPIWVTGATS